MVEFSMTLSDPNPGFKITVYLQVEYLNNGATLLNYTTYNYRPLWGSTENVQKLGVVVENFAQEGRTFSCLRTIARYGEAEVADKLARGH